MRAQFGRDDLQMCKARRLESISTPPSAQLLDPLLVHGTDRATTQQINNSGQGREKNQANVYVYITRPRTVRVSRRQIDAVGWSSPPAADKDFYYTITASHVKRCLWQSSLTFEWSDLGTFFDREVVPVPPRPVQ
jgi:hypothetical protein